MALRETQAVDLSRSSRPLLGIGLKVTATFAFTLMAAIARHLGETIPVGQIVFFRSAFAFVPIAIFMLVAGHGLSSLATKRPLSHARRAFTGIFAMFTYFGALTYLPIADVTAIGFASPLAVVALAALMLGERVHLYRWSAVAIGFVGVLIMISPHLSDSAGTSAIGIGLAITNAALVAFTMIFIRMMSGTESALAIAFYFQLTCSVASLLTLPFAWVTPTMEQFALLVMLGVLGGIGQLFMTNSYRFAQASTLANFEYAAMIWAIFFGWLFFAELPAAAVYVGAAIVIASGLFIVWRERQLGLREPTEQAIEPR